MAILKTKSLDPNITDEELENTGVKVKSFISFRRAIEDTLSIDGRHNITEVKGYEVTDEGIEVIYK